MLTWCDPSKTSSQSINPWFSIWKRRFITNKHQTSNNLLVSGLFVTSLMACLRYWLIRISVRWMRLWYVRLAAQSGAAHVERSWNDVRVTWVLSENDVMKNACSLCAKTSRVGRSFWHDVTQTPLHRYIITLIYAHALSTCSRYLAASYSEDWYRNHMPDRNIILFSSHT